ncbi:MAG: DUF1853 family protein [Flavobacteriales bacterium]|nr:DUF1853 family protein [Flavobacteriales bacterium]
MNGHGIVIFVPMLLKALPVFHDPDVAALSWAIASAPLVKENCGELPIIDEEWCDQQLELHLDWLKQLDSDPSPLKNFIQDDDAKLLGKRFESLLAFWFEQSPHFELIGRNIRFENSGASGEADFLIRDLIDGELIHLEAACKYYIGLPYSPKRNTWVGPNGIDSLQLKLEKLRKQVNLFRTTPGKKFLEEHGLEIPGRAVLLKGYFFIRCSHCPCLLLRQMLTVITVPAGTFIEQNFPFLIMILSNGLFYLSRVGCVLFIFMTVM